MLNKTVEMYADGYELIEIAEENNLSKEEVIKNIISFKELSKIACGKMRFKFNQEFKDVIISRYQSGESSINEISKELHLSTSTVSKYLKDAGIDTKQVSNNPYVVIEDWDEFHRCPTCNETRNVTRLGLHNQDESHVTKHQSFCIACNTEWYQAVVGVTEEKTPVYETRKVLWHSVN